VFQLLPCQQCGSWHTIFQCLSYNNCVCIARCASCPPLCSRVLLCCPSVFCVGYLLVLSASCVACFFLHGFNFSEFHTATLPSPLPLPRVGSGAILLHTANCSRWAGLAPAGPSGKVQHSTLPALLLQHVVLFYAAIIVVQSPTFELVSDLGMCLLISCLLFMCSVCWVCVLGAGGKNACGQWPLPWLVCCHASGQAAAWLLPQLRMQVLQLLSPLMTGPAQHGVLTRVLEASV
jgi:hypothetical protein